MKPMQTLDEAECAVPHESIEALEEGDLGVLNEDTRTWRVTEVVTQRVTDAPDGTDARRALRLEAGTGDVFGLVLTRAGATYEAELHALDADHWLEADRTFAVQQVERLTTGLNWRVLRRSGPPEVYPPSLTLFARPTEAHGPRVSLLRELMTEISVSSRRVSGTTRGPA